MATGDCRGVGVGVSVMIWRYIIRWLAGFVLIASRPRGSKMRTWLDVANDVGYDFSPKRCAINRSQREGSHTRKEQHTREHCRGMSFLPQMSNVLENVLRNLRMSFTLVH